MSTMCECGSTCLKEQLKKMGTTGAIELTRTVSLDRKLENPIQETLKE